MIGQDRKVNIRLIEGVREAPPETGMRWSGEDVQAGLELVKLLFARPYVEEIEKVDASLTLTGLRIAAGHLGLKW